VSGRIDGREVPFTADGQALLALDMDARPGSATFRVQVSRENRVVAELGQAITVGRRQYKEERLNLPEKKVELDPGDQARAARETAAIRDTFAVRGGRAGFVYGFRKPVEGRTGGLFGSRRILNGKPRSPHNGVDIAAPRGSAVVTTAPGTVVLVGHDFFFTGNTVIVHHGHGVLSLYAHLDQIEVAQGAWLDVGSRVGTLGMTGRATGPHLHWGAWVRGERVDPLMLPGVSGS
jgi:murein DD-endopeptidase MepM/ murein hydrolase activator NlpD